MIDGTSALRNESVSRIYVLEEVKKSRRNAIVASTRSSGRHLLNAGSRDERQDEARMPQYGLHDSDICVEGADQSSYENYEEERLYTLEEAMELLEHNRLAEKERVKEKRRQESKKRHYFLRQKAVGMLLTVIPMLLGIYAEDMTAAIILVPLGLLMLFTRKRIFADRHWFLA